MDRVGSLVKEDVGNDAQDLRDGPWRGVQVDSWAAERCCAESAESANDFL